ncbi:MAG: 3-dehydroquinate synthase II [Candidatus Nitrosopolaris sp.]
MTDTKAKDIIVSPTVAKSELGGFLSELKDVRIVNIDPKLAPGVGFKIIFESKDADMIICKTIDELRNTKSTDKVLGFSKTILSNADLEEVILASTLGAEFVIVNAVNWKIIPLENIISKLHKSGTKVYTTAKNAAEVRTMFEILELGVDGVILSTDNPKEVEQSRQYLDNPTFTIRPVRILEVREVGSGERVCVDTTSILTTGEGMLVGSRSNFMFLIHNESEGSAFTSPRPFRVNAGAIYCYTIIPGGKTKYLSEMESGTEVLIVNKEGTTRRVTVGRSKIETRPLKLVRGEINGEVGTVILQNAETITFVTGDARLIPVTELKVGDEILGCAHPQTGRHFGIEVDEHIIEK